MLTFTCPHNRGKTTVTLRLRVRRFRCDTRACDRRIVAERFPGVVAPHARRTDEQPAVVEAVALALGGAPGARLAATLGVPVSGSTLRRRLRAMAAEATTAPRILGVDDGSLKRGRTYATILVDLERRQSIDLLPDRSAETLAGWVTRHAGVEIVSRDRAGADADGARRGAPAAIQVADRVHLIANIGETLERLLVHHHAMLRAAAAASAADQAVDQALAAPPTPAAPSRREEEAVARRARRQARDDDVQRLRGEGHSIRESAGHLRMSRTTVMTYLRADTCPMPGPRPTRRSLVDPWAPYRRSRWAEGRRDATGLFREITALGFAGGPVHRRRPARPLARRGAPPWPLPGRAARRGGGPAPRAAAGARPLPPPRPLAADRAGAPHARPRRLPRAVADRVSGHRARGGPGAGVPSPGARSGSGQARTLAGRGAAE